MCLEEIAYIKGKIDERGNVGALDRSQIYDV